APEAGSFKAYDCPSDDGSAIMVEWNEPKDQPAGAWYVVEVARSEKELVAGKGKPWKVAPLKAARACETPKYFESTPGNGSRLFAVIPPSAAMKGAGAAPIPFERIQRLARAGVLGPELVARALAAARIEKPAKKFTPQERIRRTWYDRLKAKLGLIEKLGKLVDGGFLSSADAKAVVAIVGDETPEDQLTPEQSADRKWVTRMETAIPTALAAADLKASGVITDEHLKQIAAALGNRKEPANLTEAQASDRAWLFWLNANLSVATQWEALRGAKGKDERTAPPVLTDSDAQKILTLLRNPPEVVESEAFKIEKEWLGRLGQWADLLTQLDEFKAKGVLTDKELEQIAQVARGRKLKDQLTLEEKGGWEWLDRLAGAQEFLLNLEKYLPEEKPSTTAPASKPAAEVSDDERLEKEKDSRLRGLIGKDHVARIVAVAHDGQADETIGGQAQSERRWFQLLSDYVDTKAQAREQDQARDQAGREWYFRVAATDGVEKAYAGGNAAPTVASAEARPNLFKRYKVNNLVFAGLFSMVVLGFIWVAQRKGDLFIRRIAGLDAVDEAIGRATEMGRPVYFVHGLASLGDLSTMAALTILGRIARRAAEYDTRVRVMNCDPLVTAVSQEVVQQAYTQAGRPDAYNPDEVSLISSDQFAYVAAVGGLMVREQPAAIFMIGYFYAESLYLAETGATTGAIQIAGTDAYTQLPFFITTCDYTLIGEELYAASAYLSREPRMLGSLRGQDVGKVFLMAAIVVVTAVLTAAAWAGESLPWLENLFKTF
ncbi:MAG: hypothetical protein NT031_01645, partial [Planctomycetota bacterium]|nr:hypothetical protein [Planctomycetota bacterium]